MRRKKTEYRQVKHLIVQLDIVCLKRKVSTSPEIHSMSLIRSVFEDFSTKTFKECLKYLFFYEIMIYNNEIENWGSPISSPPGFLKKLNFVTARYCLTHTKCHALHENRLIEL